MILPDSAQNFKSLYIGMRNQKGWGDKTSALFVKTIFHLHNNEYPKELKIWNDVPFEIDNNDELYLPVDKVIMSIFKQLDSDINWSFNTINNQLKKYYSGTDIEVWDDLWFWGFITQNGSGNDRIFAWNENKYWALKESDKSPQTIDIIRVKSKEFLSLL